METSQVAALDQLTAQGDTIAQAAGVYLNRLRQAGFTEATAEQLASDYHERLLTAAFPKTKRNASST